MAFNDSDRQAAYRRAGGMCECKMATCNHILGRCYSTLGSDWELHHQHSQAAGGSDALSNGIAMCIPCHQRTRTYGRRW